MAENTLKEEIGTIGDENSNPNNAEIVKRSKKISFAKPTAWTYIKYGLIAGSIVGLGFLGYKALKAGPVDPDEVAASV